MKSAKSRLLVPLLALFIIASLIAFQLFSKEILNKRNTTLETLHHIHTTIDALEYEVLRTSLVLYQSYDHITRYLKKLEELNTTLERLLAKEPPHIKRLLERYEAEYKEKEYLLLRFSAQNSLIKNSLIYIPKITKELLEHNLSQECVKLLGSMLATTFLTKNSMDMSFLEGLKKDLQYLRTLSIHPDLALKKRLLEIHLNIFIQNFPKLNHLIDQILAPTLHDRLQLLANALDKEFRANLRFVDAIFIFVVLLYMLALGIIVSILRKLRQENHQLQRLKQHLVQQARLDALTNLRNRKAFKEDRRHIKHPLFILLNIQGFKHFNELYGITAGDHILRQCADKLRSFCAAHLPDALLYRIGADEFALLIEEHEPIDEKRLIKAMLDFFEKEPIGYKNIYTTISLLATASRKRPLLETANLAMHQLKKLRHLHFLVYEDELGLIQEIKQNIKRSKILKNAIESGNLLPYFQPILSTKSNELVKFEVLARIKHEEKIESIYPYLAVAKELSLYNRLTRTIITQAIETIKSKGVKVAINLSMQDLEDEDLIDFLKTELGNNPHLASSITFELLESEALRDYTLARRFIEEIKTFGVRVGIDDFGSGYSNFAHIFNLNIDFIKIDGSLIKDIDTNPLSYAITRSITALAHEFGIEVVAEFVHNEAVFTKIVELGIDYAQGFYLAKPKPL